MISLTNGFTSAAGNHYYQDTRLSDRLVVYYHIGEGYANTFLNGITLLCWEGSKAKIIAQKFWDGFNAKCFSEPFAKEQSLLLLKDYLVGQAKQFGTQVCEQQMLSIAREVIEETPHKRFT